ASGTRIHSRSVLKTTKNARPPPLGGPMNENSAGGVLSVCRYWARANSVPPKRIVAVKAATVSDRSAAIARLTWVRLTRRPNQPMNTAQPRPKIAPMATAAIEPDRALDAAPTKASAVPTTSSGRRSRVAVAVLDVTRGSPFIWTDLLVEPPNRHDGPIQG